jgi:hypothetical protein
MKARIVVLLCVVALALVAVPANAQIFSIQFDENGNGLINGTTPDQGVLMLDPQSGQIALAYALPSLVGGGDVGVMEPNSSTDLSDGLRFEDINGVSYMFFFSLAGGGDLADTGIPSGGFSGFFVNENNDGSFTFLAGGGGNNSYFGKSSAETTVPEPTSLLMLGSGLVGLAGVVRRRFLS